MHIGRYKVLGRLGRGGMGGVYKVHHDKLDLVMALKLLQPHELLEHFMGADQVRAAFEREAQLLASSDHEHLARVWDLDSHQGHLFMVLEYLCMNLGALIGEGHVLEQPTRTVPWDRALDYVSQTLSGLDYLHSRGVAHLDIKPGNLMLNSQGQIKIIDLGLSRIAGEHWETPKGLKIGTPGYCPPEQEHNPDQADHRADLYALAVVLHRLVTGYLPETQAFDTHPWADFFHKALALDPQERFQQASDMRVALEALQAGVDMEATCLWHEPTCVLRGPLRSTFVRTGVQEHPFSFLDHLSRPKEFRAVALEPVSDGWLDPCLQLVWGEVSPWPMTWNNAQDYIRNLGAQWRLPTVEELASLLQPNQDPTQFCQRSFDNRYLWIWSGDRRSYTSAWFVDIGGAAVLFQDLTCRFYVRPVRRA